MQCYCSWWCVIDALLINLLLAVAATAWITLYPLEWLIELMEVRQLP